MSDFKEYRVQIWFDGSEEWRLYGKLHRENGPASITSTGLKSWYINGKFMTEDEHRLATTEVKELTVAEISDLLGYKVKVVK